MSATNPHSNQRQRERPQQTQTQTHTHAQTGSSTQTGTEAPAPAAPAILRLRGAHPPSDHRVQWAESVVDNEGLGRKRSKGKISPIAIIRKVKSNVYRDSLLHIPRAAPSRRVLRRVVFGRRLILIFVGLGLGCRLGRRERAGRPAGASDGGPAAPAAQPKPQP